MQNSLPFDETKEHPRTDKKLLNRQSPLLPGEPSGSLIYSRTLASTLTAALSLFLLIVQKVHFYRLLPLNCLVELIFLKFKASSYKK